MEHAHKITTSTATITITQHQVKENGALTHKRRARKRLKQMRSPLRSFEPSEKTNVIANVVNDIGQI